MITHALRLLCALGVALALFGAPTAIADPHDDVTAQQEELDIQEGYLDSVEIKIAVNLHDLMTGKAAYVRDGASENVVAFTEQKHRLEGVVKELRATVRKTKPIPAAAEKVEQGLAAKQAEVDAAVDAILAAKIGAPRKAAFKTYEKRDQERTGLQKQWRKLMGKPTRR